MGDCVLNKVVLYDSLVFSPAAALLGPLGMTVNQAPFCAFGELGSHAKGENNFLLAELLAATPENTTFAVIWNFCVLPYATRPQPLFLHTTTHSCIKWFKEK